MKKVQLEEVVYVNWEESERGWGTRPDGCSLHLTEKDYKTFLKDYWDKQPDRIPDEYSRPVGRAVPAHVCSELYEKIKQTDSGLRLMDHQETELAEKKDLVYGAQRSGWVAVSKNLRKLV